MARNLSKNRHAMNGSKTRRGSVGDGFALMARKSTRKVSHQPRGYSHPQPVGSAKLLDSEEGLVHDDEGKATQTVDADASLVCTITRRDDPAVALILLAGMQCCRVVHYHPRDGSYVVSVMLVDSDEYRDAQVALSLAGEDTARATEFYIERRTSPPRSSCS